MPALTLFDSRTHRIIAPHPPRYDTWPSATRAAWRANGALLPCGPGFRGIGWPETPTVRLAALAEWLGPQRIATHHAAAWVWGAARHVEFPIDVTMTPGTRRPLLAPSDLLIREMRASADDIVVLGEFMVTSPLRTALDLLYRTEGFSVVERVSCRLLTRRIEGGLNALHDHLHTHRRPHRTLALRRLAWMMP